MQDVSWSCKGRPRLHRSTGAISTRCSRSPKAVSAISSPFSAPRLTRPARPMPADDAFAAFVTRVRAFHITDRSMLRAQHEIEAALAAATADERARAVYLRAVRRYFEGFCDEARRHLRDVDRRLEHAGQVQFNLNAERGVAVKR